MLCSAEPARQPPNKGLLLTARRASLRSARRPAAEAPAVGRAGFWLRVVVELADAGPIRVTGPIDAGDACRPLDHNIPEIGARFGAAPMKSEMRN